MKCRHCNNNLTYTFADLGSSPPSNSYVLETNLLKKQKLYPLKVMVCEKCLLVQTLDFVEMDEMFSNDYAYFSSFSKTWLKHSKDFVDDVIHRFKLTKNSKVVEIAANDGYLLQYVKAKNIPCYGIEPTKSTADVAREKGIKIIESFFCIDKAVELKNNKSQADLTIANNVLAHVPDINDFVQAFSILLKDNGVASFEFPHLLKLVEGSQFDTIYHEHYSYLSLIAVEAIFEKCGLSIFDIEELRTHGGSLRVFAQRSDTGTYSISKCIEIIRKKEINAGMDKIDFYKGFQVKIKKIKTDFLDFLIKAKRERKTVAAYGAAAKGNTVLNFCGVGKDLVSFVVDKNPAKIGKFMPGSLIPIVNEMHLKQSKPDYILILPWNLDKEIKVQLEYINDWKGKFVTVIPEIEFSNK